MLKDVVLRVLNNTVFEYFENIDASQLQLSVFGGDVALYNLKLKSNICESLGLPFRLSAGRCGQLTLKIPWTSLYSQPVEIGLKELFVLLVPGSSVPYNEEIEETARQKLKLRIVENIEAAQREFRIQSEIPDGQESGGNFFDRLSMQILKNLQIQIESIHVRYEDDQANPGKLFVVGAVLTNLSVLTTDTDWNTKYVVDNVSTIHKLLNLDGLALYWNSDTSHISRDYSNEDLRVEQMKSLLNQHQSPFDFMVGPISTITKLIVTPNPEKGPTPFSSPKMIFETVVHELALAVSNLQFQDILQLAESWDFLYRRQLYRKHRPTDKGYRGNYKTWWRFAYKCILVDIQRKRNNWRWDVIKSHRQDCKAYYSTMYKKTVGHKSSAEVESELSHLEGKLDMFNLLLIRKQVDLCRERKEKEEAAAKKNRGWLSGWFGSSPGDETDFIPKEMSLEEKEALQKAIGYSENAVPVNYPPEFVKIRINFRLDTLKFLILQDDRKRGEEFSETILDLRIIRFQTLIDTRPIKNGMSLGFKLGSIKATSGNADDNQSTRIISARNVEGIEYFMDLGFERFPLNSDLDQKLYLMGQPLEILYDARTTQKLLECFTIPQQVSLQRLQAKALSKYIEWKAHSAVGIMRMVENRGKVDININLQAPYILVPQNGLLSLAANVLVIELGELSIKSKPQTSPEPNGKHELVSDPHAINAAVLQLSYETFMVELKDFQVSFAFKGEVYRSSKTDIRGISQKQMPIHLIKSGVVVVKVDQCIVPDDARFPKIKIHSSLPLIDFDIPENRLMQLVNLIVTLPLPKPPNPQPFTPSQTDLTEDASFQESIMVTHIAFLDMDAPNTKSTTEEAVQITEFFLEFNIETIKIRVSRLNGREVETMMALELYSITANLTSKTFGTSMDAKLGGITLSALGQDSSVPLYLIKTPKTDESLLHIHVFTVTPDCPKSQSIKVKQHVNLEVSSIEGTLHREVLMTLVDFVDSLSAHVAHELLALERGLEEEEMARPTKKKKQRSIIETHTRALAKKFGNDEGDVLIKIEAKLSRLTINVSTKQKNIMKLIMGNLNGSFVQKAHKFEMFFQLIQFNIINLDSTSHYKKILTVDADRVMFIHVTKFDDAGSKDADVSKCDMKIKVETGSPKIHVLGSFLVEVMNFANQFQSAKTAVKEASAAAAEAATQNVKTAYGNDSRISLDIELRAPKIIVPENDRSLSVLMFDFGNLKFSNVFSLVRTKERNAVMDEMEINIENVKMSRGQIDIKTQETVCECLVLDPVTFTGKVKRNLSSWFKEIPGVTFNGKLHSTVLRVSSEDMEVIVNCALDKLTALQEIPSNTDIHTVKSSSSPIGLYSLEEVKSNVEVGAEISLSLDLSLNNLGTVLYQGSSNLRGKKGIVPRDQNASLAEFHIDSIVASASVSTSNHVNCSVTLDNLDLKDSRPASGRRALKNLIERRAEGGQSGPMIQFSLKQSPVETLVDLTTKSLTILLCLDHVMQVTRFFKSSFNKDKPSVNLPAEITKYKRKFALTNFKPIKGLKISQGKARPRRSQNQMLNNTPLKGNFKLESMEIVFVESMDTIHTNAVLLNCEISMGLTSVGDKLKLDGKIEGVQLNTCNFNPEHRSQSLAEVVSPTTIKILGEASKEAGLELKVSLSDIFVRLSAGTMELLTKISESFTVSDLEQLESLSELDNSEIWDVQLLEERGLWYLEPGAINTHNCSTRTHPEASDFADAEVTMPNAENSKEKLVLKSGSIVLTFEAGSEIITVPLLLVEAAVELQVVDWSLDLEIGGKIEIAAAYFNAGVGIWEYLIEPVPTGSYSNASWRPLKILFSVTKGLTDEFSHLLQNQSATSLVCLNEPDSEGVKRGFETVCTFQCNDVMEFTITRTAVQVLTLLAETFNAARKTLVMKREISTAPYIITNDTGMEITVNLRDTPFTVMVDEKPVKKFRLQSGYEMELSLVNDFAHYSILKEQQMAEDRWIHISIPSASFQTRVPVSKAEVRCYTLTSGERITCEVWVKDCSRVVTFRGSIQIVNALTIPVDILTKDLEFIDTIQSKHRFNVPLKYLKGDGVFFFAPERFKSSTESFELFSATEHTSSSSKIASSNKRFLTCPNYKGDSTFYIKVLIKSSQVMFENTNRYAVNCLNHEIRLEPTFFINNMLPVPIAYINSKGDEVDVAEKAKMIQITNLPPNANTFDIPIRIKGYDGLTWDSRITIGTNTERLSAWSFVCTTESRVLTLGVHKDQSIVDQLIIHIYAPFWMINRTGMNLSYKIDKDKDITRHPTEKGIVLFSYPATDFFNKANQARVKPDEADWTSPFATETVGLSSFLSSKSAKKNYEFGLSIKLCHGGLTKTIVFTPKFYLMNQCPFSVKVKEESEGTDEILLLPELSVPFWPKGTDPRLTVRIDGTGEKSAAFYYEIGHSSCLKLKNKFGGLFVDVNVGETRIVITISEYSRGRAPNLFMNVTDDMTLGYKQEGGSQSSVLKPGETQLIAFPEPAKTRNMLWYPLKADGQPSEKEFKDPITADTYFEFDWTNERGETGRYFWISYIEELQRVTVLAKDEHLVKYLKSARDLELPTAEIVLLITSIGLSLVDNIKCKELLYLRMSSWGVMWEEQLSPDKYRPFPKEQSDALEAVYQSYVDMKSNGSGIFKLDSGMEVDLKSMQIIKPHQRTIIRSPQQPGFWSHIKIFPHSSQFHLKVNRLQIDNQLPDATFVYLLSPVAQAKSVATNESDGRKPFIELVFRQGNPAHSSSAIIKFIHCSFLVQEFQIKLDMGLINALTEMFTLQVGTAKTSKMMENFKTDFNTALMSIEEHQRQTVVSIGSKMFYSYLHLSPLKVRVSFSMNGSGSESSNVLLLLLQGLGIDKLADFQDVPFQLACFELRSKLLSDDQLGGMVISHYTTQGIKQFYVLILGLDFLGNPYALITGISEGIGAFFYEPIQGAILGPDAFREGLSLGVRSLVGHTVGGAAEALSKVTGTIGKGFAALTLDNEFQRQRNEAMRQGPQGTSFAATARGFLKNGIFDTVTGIVTNPLKGAQDEGLQGFGKGLLKGAVGLLTRPVVGAADLARGTLDSFRRAVQDGDDLDQVRPPRAVQCTSALQPYSLQAGKGNQIIQELIRRDRLYLKSETYVAHIPVNNNQALLITDRRVFLLKLTDAYGGSAVIWEHEWKDFAMQPYVVEKGLEFQLKNPNPKNLNKQNPASQLYVHISDPSVCMWILDSICVTMTLDTEADNLQ